MTRKGLIRCKTKQNKPIKNIFCYKHEKKTKKKPTKQQQQQNNNNKTKKAKNITKQKQKQNKTKPIRIKQVYVRMYVFCFIKSTTIFVLLNQLLTG